MSRDQLKQAIEDVMQGYFERNGVEESTGMTLEVVAQAGKDAFGNIHVAVDVEFV